MQFMQSIAGIADEYLPGLSTKHYYNRKPLNSSGAELKKGWKKIWNTLSAGAYVHAEIK